MNGVPEMKTKTSMILVSIVALLAVGGCIPQPPTSTPQTQANATTPLASEEFTLKTAMIDGKMAYLGVGGEIDGRVNPDLVVAEGVTVVIELVNGDGMPHDLAIPELGAQSTLLTSKTQVTSLQFTPEKSGSYVYYCTVSGHRQAGMEGVLVVSRP